MSTTRLFILGVIRFSEPVHGYDIKRELESWHVEEWAHVAYGSIYHALKTLAKDGLIEPVDTGQVGRRPARTTYRITVAGEREYQRLLRDHWWSVQVPKDPFMAALSFMPDLPKGAVEAVKGIDLDVKEGEIFGFLGPNGAGKTTTLRMLATLITAGRRRGHGRRGRPAGATRRRSAAGSATSPRAAPHLGRHDRPRGAGPPGPAYGIRKAEAVERASRAIETFQLTEFADRKCQTYSGGQRRRLDIALGMIHDPKVVFLDEPTTGLDPQSRAHMWDEVRRLRDEGMTVFLTTHYLDEADALCDRIAIIDHGEIVAEGTPTSSSARSPAT
jgi:ABC-type Na+ transport system ATPase subunit NatA